MARSVSPKEELKDSGAGGDFIAESQPKGKRFFALIKFILGILLLPFVYGVSLGFLNEFSQVGALVQKSFWRGVCFFVVLHLFIWELTPIFAKGQKLLEFLFVFFKPLLKIGPQLVPIFTLFSFLFYGVASLLVPEIKMYFIFAAGATIALHLTCSAKSLRSRQKDFLRANYLFGFSFIYIFNLILLGLCLNFISANFSFVDFINLSFAKSQAIFYTVFKQLFVVS